jgi:hypothetical protein
VTGDLCRKDSDCCGGDPNSGLPGAGNVVCEIDPGKVVGLCRNPTSCNPQGNVCHYQNYACSISSARSDCCGATGASKMGCQLDALGVPRCNGLGTACQASGDACASAADCCNGMRCIPDSAGALHCGDTICEPSGGNCTINGDCCPGTLCVRPSGSTVGTCNGSPPGSGGSSGTGGEAGAPATGGTAGSGGSTGGTSAGGTGGTSAGGTGGTTVGTGGTGGSTTCSEYGQTCASDADCCNAVPCTSGICVTPIVK